MDYIVEIEIVCPYCGEAFASTADTSGGSYSAIEDCNVCCRPISVDVECEVGEVLSVAASRA